MTPLRRAALAVASGLLLSLSFPKFGHAAVAWFALMPLLLALRGNTPWRAARLGYVTGFVYAVGTLYWTSLVVVQYGGLSGPAGVAVMLLLCGAVALFPALFAWLVGRWLAAVGPGALLLAPVAWVATEMLRAYAFLRFSWCLLGYTQWRNLPVLQVASVTAVYGVSFLVAGVSSVLAYAATERRPGPRRVALLGGTVVLGGLSAWGSWVLSRPLPEGAPLRVGLVQASIAQDEKWDPRKAWENVGEHMDLTRRAAAEGARLVVWPESSVPFYYDEAPEMARLLGSLVSEQGIHLVFGNDDRQGRGRSGRVWVGAKLLTPTGDLSFRYHKVRLVPFGEYVPLQPLLTLGGLFAARLVQEVGTFTPGDGARVGSADGRAFGVFICYEAIFPDFVRQFTALGADLLVNVTNDAWYGRTSAPYQHFSMAVFRAVENRKYLLRAANTGITAVVDPRGRVLAQTALFERTVLVRDVPAVSGSTFYSRHGDVFGWACVAAAAGITALSITTKTRRTSE